MAETATFDDALKTAVASAEKEVAASEVKVEEAPPAKEEVEKKETASPEKTEENVEKVEEVAKEEEEPNFNLSAEDFQAIDADPKLKKAYKSMLRDYRKKTGEVAVERKAHTERDQIIQSMIDDPDSAVRALASIRGFELVEPKKKEAAPSEVDKAFEQLTAQVGEEGAKVLKPVFDAVVSAAVNNALEKHVTPLQQQAQALTQTALAGKIESGLAKFRTEVEEQGGEWNDDVEAKMGELVGKILPAEGTTFAEYLDLLYNNVATKMNRTKAAKESITRLKTAAAAGEPSRGTRTTVEKVGITPEMSQSDAVAMAVQMAQQEMRGR